MTGDDDTVLDGLRVVTPDGVLSNGRVVVEGDRIAAVEEASATGESEPEATAASDHEGEPPVLLPGLVDLHGDDVERHLFPRPGARVDDDLAVATCDRANLAAGITTKFHAIAFEEAPDDDRSLELAADLVDAFAAATDTLVDNRVHARCEVSNPTAVETVEAVLDRDVVDLVSLMRHVPGEGQFENDEAFRRRYLEDRSASVEGVERTAARRECPRATRLARMARIVEAAEAADVAVASHDDERPAVVDWLADRGVDVSEYPVTMAAAERASERGLTTAMGAPNLVRGGSLWDNLAASDAVEAGLLDALCSDYHPPSLLAAPFVETGEPLHERVARVTAAPADAAGLDDRGRVEPGARADLVVVDPSPVPTVRRVLVGGRDVYRAGSGGTRPARTPPDRARRAVDP
jgi:alpha-D-ribose 1-methylphosphonate 5-triphosphate diphosphatase